MSLRENVLTFVGKFKDDFLVPFAMEGTLSEDVIDEAAQIYYEELVDAEALSRKISVTLDGEWRELHPLNMVSFKVKEREFKSFTHWIYACCFFEADEEMVTYICDSKNAEIAKKRGTSALAEGTSKREDWEYSRETNVKLGYRCLLEQHEELRVKFLATKASIIFEHSSDELLGLGADGKGKNLLPKVLTELRKEMK